MKPKRISLGTRNTLVGLSFILPNFIGFAIFILIPVLFSLGLSFVEWNGFNKASFVGFKNFVTLFNDKYFAQAMQRTILFTVVNVVVTALVAMGLAVLCNKKIRGVGLFRSAMFFPYIASIVAVGAVWGMLFMRDFGPINNILRAVGIANPPGWLTSTSSALWGVIIVSVWKNMGYYMIIYLAALQGIPSELRESSAVDGATGFRHFWKITFPLLAPAHFFVVLMLTINSFKAFDLIFVLTEGGPGQATTLIVNYIYKQGFISEKLGVASAAATILFAVVAVITAIQFKAEKKMDY